MKESGYIIDKRRIEVEKRVSKPKPQTINPSWVYAPLFYPLTKQKNPYDMLIVMHGKICVVYQSNKRRNCYNKNQQERKKSSHMSILIYRVEFFYD